MITFNSLSCFLNVWVSIRTTISQPSSIKILVYVRIKMNWMNPCPTSDDRKKWEVGYWFLARFKYEKCKGEGKWIGRSGRVNENDTFLVSFLGSKSIKNLMDIFMHSLNYWIQQRFIKRKLYVRLHVYTFPAIVEILDLCEYSEITYFLL